MEIQPYNRTFRSQPDPQSCRAARLSASLASCLSEKPNLCQFAMPWGYSFLCGHPDRDAIIANTEITDENARNE